MTCIKPTCGIGAVGGCDPTCECGPDLCNLPNPYVVNAEASQECHCTTVVQQLYVTGLSLKASIVMPACDGEVVAAIAGIHSTIIGSYLWNPSYGYLKVTGFDYATEQITLTNECQTSNVAAGTTIPACTLFLVVDEPCCDAGVGGVLYYPYLKVDFTAPAIGNCLDITVTSIVGLATGMQIQIGTGIYRIAGISEPSIINVCNDGSGVTAGVVIEALDSFGIYITPILPIGVALCGGSSATTGALVVCSDGLPTVLDGDTAGYIPVLVDPATNTVEFQDPASIFSIDPCAWDLSDRVLNGIVNFYAIQPGGVIGVGVSTTLNRMTDSPVVIENDTCAPCSVLLAFSGRSTGNFNASSGDYANVAIELSVGTNTAPIGTSVVASGTPVATVYNELAFNRTANPILHTSRVEWVNSYEIPAYQELNIGMQVKVTHNASDVTWYDTDVVYGEIKGYFLSI